MKVIIATLLCLVFAYASAQQIWKFCPGDRSKDLLTISSVTLNPPTPKSGAEFSVSVEGELKQDISGDDFVDVDVLYSGVELYQGKVKVCSLFQCPVKAGKLTQTFTQTVPAFAPPGGPYTGSARLSDVNNNNFTCIVFDFMMGSSAEKAN